jgi:2,3-bisphosphoglycerate-independent phosphoglycerate mutase
VKPIILVIFDGLGDRPIKELGYMTPLEAAVTPDLDKLAELGITGMLHTIERGVRPGSDVAHLALFGYNPKFYYAGRGPYEASGYGIDLMEGDIAFRGNLGTVDDNFIVVDRRAGRIESSDAFAEKINGLEIDGIKVIAKAGLNHRIAVVLRGQGLSEKITDVDPHMVNKPLKKCLAKFDGDDKAKFTTKVVNKLIDKAHMIFKSHPINKERAKKNLPLANCLLLRGAGRMAKYESFQEKYNLRSACIAGAGLYKGIAKIVGMEIIDVEGANGKANTNVVGKINKAIEMVKVYDFVFVHIKATDSLAEDGKALEKRDFITRADKALSPLIPLVEKREIILAVTGDHSTASDLKIHTADELPILIAGFGVRTDRVKSFGERSCQSGGIGHMEGAEDLMDMLINLRGDTKLYGN